jgi:hypothetical protein
MATEVQNNVALLHRKEWQTMMPTPTASAIGTVVVQDQSGNDNTALVLNSGTVHYLYHHDEDDFVQIPSGAFGGTWVAGVCGVYYPWSLTYTANGGSTTTVTVAAASFNLNGFVKDQTIEFLTGTAANIGLRRTITGINTIGTGNITLTLSSAVTGSVANNDTFRISSGSFFVMSSGTLAANCWKRYDKATCTWTDRAYATGGSTNSVDARVVSPYIFTENYDSGTAEADTSSSTTLTCTGKTWGNDQWKNYQVRITGGTGMGQIRLITTNDTDTLTVASWTAPDDSSTFVIEGDENAIYYIGNDNVNLYKYSISANTWSTVSVTAPRALKPVAGMSADFVGKTGITEWANTSDIKDGRYIYSLRGNSYIIDRYDITTLAWVATTGVPYGNTLVTFGNGDGTFCNGRYIYIQKEGSGTVPVRIYKYALRGNYLEPVSTDWYLGGNAVVGNKVWVKNLSTTGTIKWLYYISGTSSIMRRIMLF